MRVGIIGLGLLGGSVAQALKSSGGSVEILGYDRVEQTGAHARAAGAIDRIGTDAERVAGWAEVLIYATPLDATLEFLHEHAALWSRSALVMDVASLKAPVEERIRAVSGGGQWIGAHPMAGGEKSGFGAARPDLFQGTQVWLVRAASDALGVSGGAGTDSNGERAERFWTSLGATPGWIDATEHDALMVDASHLPQLVASTLAATLARAGLTRQDLGQGGLDMTRLSGSSPELWADLLAISGPDVAARMRELAKELEILAGSMERGEVDRITELMRRTRVWKEGGPWS